MISYIEMRWDYIANKRYHVHLAMHLAMKTSKLTDLENRKNTLTVQPNKHETAPNFVQLNPNLTSDCLLI